MIQVCDNCEAFKAFGEKCWFYWEGKKSCSQYRDSFSNEPCFKNADIQIIPISEVR